MSSKPTFSSTGKWVHFLGGSFKEVLADFLMWLEQDDGNPILIKSGLMHRNNEFHVLPNSLSVEYDNEMGDYSLEIFYGD